MEWIPIFLRKQTYFGRKKWFGIALENTEFPLSPSPSVIRVFVVGGDFAKKKN